MFFRQDGSALQTRPYSFHYVTLQHFFMTAVQILNNRNNRYFYVNKY